jgi:hypothetical protein
MAVRRTINSSLPPKRTDLTPESVERVDAQDAEEASLPEITAEEYPELHALLVEAIEEVRAGKAERWP